MKRCLSTRVSPLTKFLAGRESGGGLRTGYTHLFNKGKIDRSAPQAFRQLVRDNAHTGQTSGLVPGFVQANFVAVPKEHAFDFTLFALRNPKACPILDITDAGSAEPLTVAPGADLRTDIPKYLVYRDGELAEERSDVTDLWSGDMVGFLLGCSFSWEQLLQSQGLCPRQIEQQKNVPMFQSNVSNVPAGVFKGDLVVSMRPYTPDDALKTAEITSCYPGAHGGPVHWGEPEKIGIDADKLSSPDWGDSVTINSGEVPVFWACGVTPQTAIQQSKIPFAITHAPGHMFICDLMDHELEVTSEQ